MQPKYEFVHVVLVPTHYLQVESQALTPAGGGWAEQLDPSTITQEQLSALTSLLDLHFFGGQLHGKLLQQQKLSNNKAGKGRKSSSSSNRIPRTGGGNSRRSKGNRPVTTGGEDMSEACLHRAAEFEHTNALEPNPVDEATVIAAEAGGVDVPAVVAVGCNKLQSTLPAPICSRGCSEVASSAPGDAGTAGAAPQEAAADVAGSKPPRASEQSLSTAGAAVAAEGERGARCKASARGIHIGRRPPKQQEMAGPCQGVADREAPACGTIFQYNLVDVRGPDGDWLALFDASNNAIFLNRWRWAKDISEHQPLNCEGAICTSRLQLLLHTLAHELVHALVYNAFPEMDQSSPAYLADDRHGPIFHLLNRQLFGHTDSGALGHVPRSGRRSTGMKLLR